MNIQTATTLLEIVGRASAPIAEQFGTPAHQALPEWQMWHDSINQTLMAQLTQIADNGNIADDKLLHPFLMETPLAWQAWAVALVITDQSPVPLIADYRIYTMAKVEALISNNVCSKEQAHEMCHILFSNFVELLLASMGDLLTDEDE